MFDVVRLWNGLQEPSLVSVPSSTVSLLLRSDCDLSSRARLACTDGVLHKLQHTNIPGQMFNWIRYFLTGRHIRVRVGTALSYLFRVEDEFTQSSAISPVLLIIIMNDILEPQKDVKLSLYAGENTIWRMEQTRT